MLSSSSRAKNGDKLNILLKNTQLEQLDRLRYLGIEVDATLNWESHTRNVIKSVAYKIHALRRPRHVTNNSLLNTLYKTTIQPCFDYTCSVWGN